MKSIIWRTLFSFWAATVVILAVVVFSNARIGQQWNEELYDVTAFDLINAGREVFRTEGVDGLAEWLRDPDNFPPGITLYVLENERVDILGREFPWFLWPVRQRQTMGGAERAPATNRENPRPRPGVTGPDGTPYTFIVGPTPQPPLGAFAFPSVQWLVLLTAVLATAVACVGLTRPLRRRLLRLQSAAVSLARGDLGARVNLQTNDEIGAVAHQFDRMAERVETMIRSQQELFRNVSHEIRSPLARIQVALALAEEERGGARDGNLERIRRETEGLEGMIQQILDLAKLENQSEEQALEDVDLIEVVSLVVDDVRFEGRSQDKCVRWNPPDGLFRVRGLADVLRSAVENVLRNAIAHTPEHTSVDVSLENWAGTARLHIRDNGEGVPDEQIDRIFEPFYRCGDRKGGAGIGLAVTQTAAALMNGAVEASRAPAGGLLVTLKLPLVQSPAHYTPGNPRA